MEPYSTNPQIFKTSANFCLCLLLWIFCLPAAAAEFKITRLDCFLDQNFYSANADISYQLSEQVNEALKNGVMLKIDLKLQLRRDNAGWWETNHFVSSRSYRIQYHSLASMFQVSNDMTSIPGTFATLEAAVIALGKVRELPIIHAKALQAGQTYTLTLTAALDVDALPLPLRPMAYLSPSWNLSSNSKTCTLTP